MPLAARQSGFSLVEILIAALVLGIGLAGIAALLITALGGTGLASERDRAALLAHSMAAQIRLVPGESPAFTSGTGEADSCEIPTDCTPRQIARSFAARFRATAREWLPQGQGVVCFDSTPQDGDAADSACDGGPLVVVKLFWQGWKGPERLAIATS